MFIFEEMGKPENPEKKLSEQSKEATTNLTHSLPENGSRRWEAGVINTTPSLLPYKKISTPWQAVFELLALVCYDSIQNVFSAGIRSN